MEILIKFDTKEKDCEVTMDGKVVDNVLDICIYKNNYDGDDYYIGILQGSRDEDNGTNTQIRTSASKEAKEAVSKGDATAVGEDLVSFAVAAVKNDFQKDVLAYFGRE